VLHNHGVINRVNDDLGFAMAERTISAAVRSSMTTVRCGAHVAST
jgi:hypothetical protein